ncbi:MAG: cysteine synthase A [Ruoffia tabacinasalis]|jgi:cysteine synthase A|uniref:Cysteine synthase A n=1 Tax=Ruoffia tabacinasalis TaxID=87458 RepID=A0A5R9DUY3_9LACT|nr:cysteine synthase A [Ruoffia tabacinasalis]MBG9978080.1 cysteine synthase A [Ruoffia tabacinasalis]TLQ41433.1 cysteine synthase A [Ruoffia tabacinasalis]HBY90148.1 cysteine synthase A [Aerococcaceae bacterium]
MLFENVVDAIGYTPVVKINGLDDSYADVYVKLEKNNPSGSVKDRPVKYIIQDLLDKGELKPGGTIVESTSGNTGVGLAMVGAALGIKVIIVMPDSMSVERRKLMQAYGAELVLTPASGGMSLAGEKAEEIAKEKNAPIFGQFKNEANVTSHEETTAREVLEDVPDVDGFVAGIGTGGTITGVGRVLKENNPETVIWSVEPEASPILTKGEAGSHKIQGLGANFIPEILDQSVIDKIETVSNDEAINTAVELAKSQGILAGFSSGANYAVALRLAKELGKGKKVVVVLPDSGERYLSSGFFGDGQAE